MSCGPDDHEQNELQEGSTEPNARREADARGVEPGTFRDPVSPDDGTNLSRTEPQIGGYEAMPTQLITENITSATGLATFASIIRHAEVVEMLSESGPFTVFAPSDDAFEALPDNMIEDLMKPENRERLREVVNNHIVPGAVTANDLQDGATLRTVGGSELSVSQEGNSIAVNGAEIVGANMMSENGVIHVVSKVLVTKD